jgi:hypothetical protein
MTMDLGAFVHEESGPGIRCTKCDALRTPLLRIECDPHAYCENCFVVAGEMFFVRIDDAGVNVWARRRVA